MHQQMPLFPILQSPKFGGSNNYVLRQYREATNLIKNVGLGRFPDTTP